MNNIDIELFVDKIKTDENAIILDVRTAEEESEGLIPNSVNINLMDAGFPEKIKALDHSKNYYVYCRAGSRSAVACELMEKNGYTAYNLIGGIQAWNTRK